MRVMLFGDDSAESRRSACSHDTDDHHSHAPQMFRRDHFRTIVLGCLLHEDSCRLHHFQKHSSIYSSKCFVMPLTMTINHRSVLKLVTILSFSWQSDLYDTYGTTCMGLSVLLKGTLVLVHGSTLLGIKPITFLLTAQMLSS